jgi:hypothetical protein
MHPRISTILLRVPMDYRVLGNTNHKVDVDALATLERVLKAICMQTTDPLFFQFEADFVASLRCIPMIVRYKLDTCGIKLKLEQWHRLAPSSRQQLVTLPCTTPEETATYRQQLQTLLREQCQTEATPLTIDAAPAWMDGTSIPEGVQEKVRMAEVSLTINQWQALSPLQRFVLIKLSRSSHENRNFLPALQEFHCWSPSP